MALALRGGQDINAIQTTAKFTVIGINSADGKPSDSATGTGIVPYFAEVPIAVTVDNVADTVIADGFRTIAEVCTGDVAQTDFCKSNA